MKVAYVNAIIKSVNDTVEDTLVMPFEKSTISIHKGLEVKGFVGTLIRFSGGISGSVFIDFPEKLVQLILSKKNIPLGASDTIFDQESNLKDFQQFVEKIMARFRENLQIKGSPFSFDSPYLFSSGEKSNVTIDTSYLNVSLTNSNVGTINLKMVGLASSYFKNDHFVVYGMSKLLTQQIIMDFVPLGFVIHAVNKVDLLEKVLKESKPTFLLLNDESFENVYSTIMKFSRQFSLTETQYIIYTDSIFDHLENSVKDDYNIIGILEKKFSTEECLTKIKEILSRTGIKSSERRKNLRYYFDKDEEAQIEFSVPKKNKSFRSFLRNISVGGMMIDISTDSPADSFKPSAVIQNLIIKLPNVNQYLTVDGIVSYNNGLYAGLQFLHMDQVNTNHLSNFIKQHTYHVTF